MGVSTSLLLSHGFLVLTPHFTVKGTLRASWAPRAWESVLPWICRGTHWNLLRPCGHSGLLTCCPRPGSPWVDIVQGIQIDLPGQAALSVHKAWA